MSIDCTFKLAYTCNKFSCQLSFNCSPKELKDLITNNVRTQMNRNNFNIIVAGTDLSEENTPLDCSIDNIPLKAIIKNIGNSCGFYIKKINSSQIINSPQTDCPICYCSMMPNNRTTLGCNHQFCESCINRWYQTGASTCPLCRR